MTELMLHQRQGIRFAKINPKNVIAHGMRLGKSRVAVEHAMETMSFPALIICPAGLRWMWFDEIKKWMPSARVQVMVHLTDEFKRGADFHVCSYEYITAAKRIPLKSIKALYVDEAHYLKNLQAKRTERVWDMVENHVENAMLMSGTLIPSRPDELYVVLRMMGSIQKYWV